MEVALNCELNNEQDAEDLVARAVRGIGDCVCKDVSEGEETLREFVVGAVEVKEGKGHCLDRGRRRE